MYAITFDMDTTRMQDVYPGESWRNGYTEIGRILREHGFDWQQGSVYFGSETVNAVTCVLAIQDVARRLNWFGPSVRDVRMLRIEEFNDLGPAVEDTIKPREA
jgi:virulence-associated protein VapD